MAVNEFGEIVRDSSTIEELPEKDFTNINNKPEDDVTPSLVEKTADGRYLIDLLGKDAPPTCYLDEVDKSFKNRYQREDGKWVIPHEGGAETKEGKPRYKANQVYTDGQIRKLETGLKKFKEEMGIEEDSLDTSQNEFSDLKPGQQRYLDRKLQDLESNNNPLDEIKSKLAREQIKQQREFANQVLTERREAENKDREKREPRDYSMLSEDTYPNKLTPTVYMADGRSLKEEGRLMISLTGDARNRYGIEEIREALNNKEVHPDGKVILNYQGGRYGTKSSPYSIDLIFTEKQVGDLEQLLKEYDEVNQTEPELQPGTPPQEIPEDAILRDTLDIDSDSEDEGTPPEKVLITPSPKTEDDEETPSQGIPGDTIIKDPFDMYDDSEEEAPPEKVLITPPPKPENNDDKLKNGILLIGEEVDSIKDELENLKTEQKRLNEDLNNRLNQRMDEILKKIEDLSKTVDSIKTTSREPVVTPPPAEVDQPVDPNQVIADLRASLSDPTTPHQDPEIDPIVVPQNPDLEQVRRERRIKRDVLIAGIVAGGLTGLLGGVSVVPVAGTVVLIGGLGSTGLRALGNWRVNKLEQKLNDPNLSTDERTRLEKRNNNWKKLVRVTDVTKSFFKGAGIGLLASSIVSQVFMGGEGIIDKLGNAQTPDASAVAHGGVDKTSGRINSDIDKTPGVEKFSGRADGTIPVETVTPETLQTDGVLVQNGRVNLPDSAWNGNLGGEAVGNLPGDTLNYSNYTGGWHEMAPHMLENDLVASGITRSQLLDNLGSSGTHRLLNWYLQQIQNGVANPDLIQALQNMNNPGAQELLRIVGK